MPKRTLQISFPTIALGNSSCCLWRELYFALRRRIVSGQFRSEGKVAFDACAGVHDWGLAKYGAESIRGAVLTGICARKGGLGNPHSKTAATHILTGAADRFTRHATAQLSGDLEILLLSGPPSVAARQ